MLDWEWDKIITAIFLLMFFITMSGIGFYQTLGLFTTETKGKES